MATPQEALENARAAARVAQQAAEAAQMHVEQAAAALGAATNAISSVIVVGALLAVGVPLTVSGTGLARAFGFIALVLASVNIFGGFLVTQRMLSMYRKKD